MTVSAVDANGRWSWGCGIEGAEGMDVSWLTDTGGGTLVRGGLGKSPQWAAESTWGGGGGGGGNTSSVVAKEERRADAALGLRSVFRPDGDWGKFMATARVEVGVIAVRCVDVTEGRPVVLGLDTPDGTDADANTTAPVGELLPAAKAAARNETGREAAVRGCRGLKGTLGGGMTIWLCWSCTAAKMASVSNFWSCRQKLLLGLDRSCLDLRRALAALSGMPRDRMR